MKRFIITSALALTLAGPALASDQLARSLGVEPGTYTTSELIALRSAMQDDEHAAANHIRRSHGADGFTVSTKNGPSAGRSQFAASVGVSPDFTTAEIAALRSAEQDDEHATANYIRKSGGSNGTFVASSKNGVSASRAQLAASVGVDPAEYSLAELVHLKSVQSSDNGRGD